VSYSACSSISKLRMRIARAIGHRKILPSPPRPVWALRAITCAMVSACSRPATTISSRTLGLKSVRSSARSWVLTVERSSSSSPSFSCYLMTNPVRYSISIPAKTPAKAAHELWRSAAPFQTISLPIW